VARHSTFTATRENPSGQFARCLRCESATYRSCTQRRHRAWRLTDQQGLLPRPANGLRGVSRCSVSEEPLDDVWLLLAALQVCT